MLTLGKVHMCFSRKWKQTAGGNRPETSPGCSGRMGHSEETEAVAQQRAVLKEVPKGHPRGQRARGHDGLVSRGQFTEILLPLRIKGVCGKGCHIRLTLELQL